MAELLRKLFWALVGLVAGAFMIGFGLCATQGGILGLRGLFSLDGDAFVILVLTAIGAGLAWGFFKLAHYCARQIPTRDDADKAPSP